MDYLLEIARVLLPRFCGADDLDLQTRPALRSLLVTFRTSYNAAWRAQARTGRERTAPAPEPAADTEAEQAAPGVLAAEVLAEVLASNPSLIPDVLRETGNRRFYPSFLQYLVTSAVDIAAERPVGVWTRLIATHYVALRRERLQRVSEILRQTRSWPADFSVGSASSPRQGSDSRNVTVSILGTGELRTAAAQVKSQYARATTYVREITGWRTADWKAVGHLLRDTEGRSESFIEALRRELLVDRELVRRLTEATAVAVPFTTAFEMELDEIETSRGRRGVNAEPSAAAHAYRRAGEMQLIGVALSGGGIRSATFNLGVLQGLAHFGLLKRVDYLSTVSGGGYIGAWLVSWSKRILSRHPRGVAAVEERLKTEPLSEPDALSVRAVRFLREYSNYLAPQSGMFSADTWSMIATWLRNTLLNQAVLVLTLCGILGIPWMLWVAQSVLTFPTSRITTAGTFRPCGAGLFAVSPVVMTSATVLVLYASALSGQQLRRFGVAPQLRARLRRDMFSQTGVLVAVVAPVFIAGALISTAVFNALGCGRAEFDLRTMWETAGIFAGAMTLVIVGGQYWRCFVDERVTAAASGWLRFRAYLWAGVVLTGATAAASLGGAAALEGLALQIRQIGAVPGKLSLLFVAIGPPAVMGIASLILVLHIGLLGRRLLDEHREWWSRLGAWLNIVSLGWLILCSISLFSPRLFEWTRDFKSGFVISSGGVVWALWTAAGVILGKRESNANMGATPTPRWLRRFVVEAAPYAFIIGLLMILAIATFETLSAHSAEALHPALLDQNRRGVAISGRSWMLLLPPGLLVVGFLLSWRVDVNEFSMHHFYKNRLVRCYLGASRDQRARRRTRIPDPFTGFDAGDDLKLSCMRVEPMPEGPSARAAKHFDNPEDTRPYVGPFPLINTALNLVKGDDLAWQERKAQSFVFTPLYSGFDWRGSAAYDGRRAPFGFRQSALYGYPPFGVGLGTAVAISGAAASPNMGYHSSPPAAFLMTMFNARLGWWMGNPRDNHNWLCSGPRRGLLYLLNELFALTNERTHFVNLSDGGHFENLGIYELVRRRCRYIIACDAEQDASMMFSGLGNAIRKCRTDFGAEITLSAIRIRPPAGGERSPLHCVIGDIKYADGSLGTLLYLKASVTGDEPADVLEYAARQPAFPHHATLSDQFFDESQFESYRKLGFHVTQAAFALPLRSANADAGQAGTTKWLDAVFERMRDYWHPGNPAVDQRRSAHASQYDSLIERIMEDTSFAFVDDAFFTPPGEKADRQVMFVGALMLDLMQRVFIDLDLENDREHPHNAGWISIFRRWKTHRAVQTAWNASKDDYSRRFQGFFKEL